MKKNKQKIHLVHGRSTAVCGANLQNVKWAIDINVCTCKNCLKFKNIGPRR